MRINHNISSMITQNSLYQVSQSMQTSLQRLSTGLRINSAADDAAGLGVSENLRTQVNGLQQAASNTQDAIALLNIADGALNEQGNILQRMRELCVQGLNSTYTSTERSYMGQEFVALRNELDRIATVTNYNKMQIFAAPAETSGGANQVYPNSNVNGDAPRQDASGAALDPNDPLFGPDDLTSSNHFNMDIGANFTTLDASSYNAVNNTYDGAADMVTIQFGQMDANGILAIAPQVPNSQASQLWDGFGWDPVNDTEDSDIDAAAQADGATSTSVNDKLTLLLKVIDGSSTLTDNEVMFAMGGNAGDTYVTGIARVNEQRARIGAMINRLQHAMNNDNTAINNQQAAESDIRDVDFATETSNFTKNQILTQSATAMLAQANAIPQGVLALLK
jgi:flagellin